MISSEDTADNSSTPFSTQFKAYCDELLETFPEYTAQIKTVNDLDRGVLLKFFSVALSELRRDINDNTDVAPKPNEFLPGISVPAQLWNSLSSQTQSAICEYIRVLGMCAFFESGETSDAAQEQWQKFMGETMGNMDFSKLTGFFTNFMEKFTESRGDDAPTAENMPENPPLFGKGFPKLPERFLKGHLAKLAEELVRDICPEDLGLTPEMLRQLEDSPSRAFELLMEVFTRNPQVLQNTFQRIGRQLQQKIATGQIKPNEIAKEAEELMKEFAENSDFVEMMEGLKSAFGMEDLGMARKAGKESSARLAAARARLQKKKEAKDAATAAAVTTSSLTHLQNTVALPTIDELVQQIETAHTNKEKLKEKTSGKSQKKPLNTKK